MGDEGPNPPIAAISPSIVHEHVRRVADELRQYDADGLLLFRDSNLLGFCGVPLGPSDRLVCGLINQDGEVAVVLPAFEAELARGEHARVCLFTWEEQEDPYAAAATAARRLGIAKGRILLDGHTWVQAHHKLAAAIPLATFAPDSLLIESIRIIKSPQEIEAIRDACRATSEVFPLIRARLREGVSEETLGREMLNALGERGVAGEVLIQGGESASVPHRPTGRRELRLGDAVVVDFVAGTGGYYGDMTRTFALGQVPQEVRQAYHVVREAQRAGIEAVSAGATCEAVDQAARTVIERAGLGPYFIHRLGHGIGLDGHEPPYLVSGNSQRLESGMCVTIEPGVYVPGRFGLRIEDVVAVTPGGCEVLSDTIAMDVPDAFRMA